MKERINKIKKQKKKKEIIFKEVKTLPRDENKEGVQDKRPKAETQ